MSSSEEEKVSENVRAFDLEANPVPLTRTVTGGSEFSRADQDMLTRVLTSGTHRPHRSDFHLGGGRPCPPDLPERDQWRVDFNGPDDPEFPHNWPMRRKVVICGILGFTTFVAAWGSSVFAPATEIIAEAYHIGDVTAILSITLYVLGFGSGPALWAPLSELYGRKPPLVVAMFGLALFSFATATAKDVQTIMLTRFFGGFCGACPLAVVAAAFSDLFNSKERGTALSIFSGCIFCGPILSPVVGGFISASYLGWRWTEYITGIMASLACILDILFYGETYHPVLLCKKAAELREQTGNWGIYAPHDDVELDIMEIITSNITRPLVMLMREPILFLLTLYSAFIYGILYLFLEAYPIVFAEGYGFKGGVIFLPYIAVAIGLMVGMGIVAIFFEPRYNAIIDRDGAATPEDRLPPMICGGVFFPVGLFWFTWAGNYHEHVHWIVPTIGGSFCGIGLVMIFLGSVNYIVDAYLMLAASAMGAKTILRSCIGAVFPLFAGAMFHNLGTNWAGTLIGCIGVLLAPVPVLFYFYGEPIRRFSKYATTEKFAKPH
ncbi:polyamine transporter 1 [Trichomonascus vanleenenianus]|uniref:MFS transporter n=1 Tax=Trichomonascus vanleenenianus TaxID=2268995 RepID=UPI003ECAB396